MKIAWAKFSMGIELDYTTAKLGHAEERAMLMKAFIEHGHKIHIVTGICKRDEELLHNIREDYSMVDDDPRFRWMSDVTYDPTDTDLNGVDILYIENGPDNITFNDGHTKQPQLRRAAQLIAAHKGLTILYQSDPQLPIPLSKFAFREYGWSHKKNTYRTGKKVDVAEDHGWGDHDEIFHDNRLIIQSKALALKKWIVNTTNPRTDYPRLKEAGVRFMHIPTGYDSDFLPGIDRHRKKSIFRIYCGFPRSRIVDFKMWMTPSITSEKRKLRNRVYGPWGSKKASKLAAELPSYDIIWGGHLEGYNAIAEHINLSRVSPYMVPKIGKPYGWVNNRLFECIHCGCLVVGDSGVFGLDGYLPEEYIVDNKQEATELLQKIADMSHKKLCRELDKQFDMVKGLNYTEYIVPYLLKTWKKLGDSNGS